MSDAARLLLATAFAALAAPALAQDAPADDAGGQAAAESPAEATNGEVQDGQQAPQDLSMGEPAGGTGENEVGSTYVRDTFGDWQMRCVRTGEERDPCQLYQLLQDDQDNSVAEISLAPLPEGQQAAAGATVITPLETLLTAQVTLAVDGGQPRRYPFTWCSAVGCFSRIGFTQADVDQFKRGRTATLTIRPVAAPDKTVPLTVSLSGFTAGYDAVAENNSGG